MAIRAAERDFEIIGEALNKLLRIEPGLNIEHAKDIIGLRNLIAHAYDSIDVQILWSILLNDIPKLKKEIEEIKSV